ncbi:MAG: aspartate aminotransferase family protein, partial [Acidobacteriota bacterium]
SGTVLEEGLRQVIDKCGVAAHINRVGSMLSIFFAEHTVNDSQTALATDRELYGRLFWALVRRGIYPPPSALESWFLSTAHGESEIEQTLSTFMQALQEALSE